MKATVTINYLMMVLIPMGIIGVLVFWMRNLIEDVRNRVTGIWINDDNTFKVLIYNLDSALEGDVIWAAPEHQRILGRSILQNFKIEFFLFGSGKYTCPFTRREFKFRMRRLSKKSLQLYMTDTEGKLVSNETWSLVA